MSTRLVVVVILACSILSAGTALADDAFVGDMMVKWYECRQQNKQDDYALRECLKAASSPYEGKTQSQTGDVRSRDDVTGATASGYGFYAATGSPWTMPDTSYDFMGYFYMEFPRESAAFKKMMDPDSGFGPKFLKEFRAKAVFVGWKSARSEKCGLKSGTCYVPMFQLSNPDDFGGGW